MVHSMKIDLPGIKDLATRRDWTLSELLEHSGVSRNAFYSLARRRSVLPASLSAIAETLGVSPGTFLIDQEPAPVWAGRIWRTVERIRDAHPEADPDNIRHTLILLEETPIERLRRALRRGRPIPVR